MTARELATNAFRDAIGMLLLGGTAIALGFLLLRFVHYWWLVAPEIALIFVLGPILVTVGLAMAVRERSKMRRRSHNEFQQR